ncbi:MAG: HlyD family efflux transporter periplasmic adaptor subunit [Desulfuromonadales bacterium]
MVLDGALALLRKPAKISHTVTSLLKSCVDMFAWIKGDYIMTVTAFIKIVRIFSIGIILLLFCSMAGCSRKKTDPATIQGYVEGEFVYISSPLPGRLERLFVQRGTQVKIGEPLFELDNAQEKAGRDETKLRLDQLRAQLSDARKGKRPTEIEASTAQLNQVKAALLYSDKELARQERLLSDEVVSVQEVDRLRSLRDQERQRVAQLEAELDTARLGLRSDQVAAVEAGARSLEATLARSEWELAQKRQTATVSGLIFDTLYHKGEWVAAGRPTIVLLPPQNIKVRVFVPQPQIASIHVGDKAKINVDGGRSPFSGSVNFISPQAEYTPPVIYSQENRQKLVYMVELSFDPETAVQLHPGQPVDVRFGAGL